MSTVNADGLVPIAAKITSVFYRSPNPAAPPYVEVGDEVNEDSIVCILEVMKCLNTISAGVKGRVVNILAENGQSVGKGEVVMLIEPSK
jgi:acetyl-CoA carboxylase biotin carboxyl carrier protein